MENTNIRKSSTKLVILYDGIKNSVFESQVLTPIKKEAESDITKNYLIISFEKAIISKTELPELPENIKIIQFKKFSYIGKISLFLNILQIQFCRLTHIEIISILARGPFAGYIAIKCFKKSKITIQARGLAAEEYDYTYTPTNIIQKLIKWFRFKTFKSLEQKVYADNINQYKLYPKIKIEAVSVALKEFLINTYGAIRENISIAEIDIPAPISMTDKNLWQSEIREKYGISPIAPVFCYSGSTHKWQMPEETVKYFKNEWIKNKNAHLLILTPNTRHFEAILKNNEILPSSFTLLSVKPVDIKKYLAAADYGILLREPHVLNWVARPTKVLEYRAAHLQVIHNNTIEWLSK